MTYDVTARSTDYFVQQQAEWAAHRADPNAPVNYLINDPARRQPYADNMKATLDYAEGHWQDDPKSYVNLTETNRIEMQEVLNTQDWDTVDPAFKKVLEENILRNQRLHETILAAHPELNREGNTSRPLP